VVEPVCYNNFMEPKSPEVNPQDFTAEGFERYRPTVEAENKPQEPKPIGRATAFARRFREKLRYYLVEKPLPK